MRSSWKVLTIAHNAVAASNRQRAAALAARPELDITLLTPSWWFEEGQRVAAPAAGQRGTAAPSLLWHVGRTLATGNGTRYVYLSHLVSLVRRWQPDVIDLHEEPFSLIALQTLILRELFAPGAALVVYSAVNTHRRWRPPYRWIERLVLRRADAAWAPSAEVPPILRAKGLPSATPTAVIPLGVDVDRFARARPLDLPGLGRPRIGFLGRLEPVKGLDVLLDALRLLQFPASLVIAGDGSQRNHLQRRATSIGGVELRPSLSYDEVPGFLKSLDVLVLPSVTILPLHREQFGRVLVEAMAAGVPVVGSSSVAIPEVIGDAGLVVPEGDPVGLASAIGRVLTEPGLAERLVERGRQRVCSLYAWPIVAARTVELFHSAMVHRLKSREVRS